MHAMNSMNLGRRSFLTSSAAGLGVLSLPGVAPAQEAAATAKFQLGIVTYNVAADWAVPTILKVCKDVGVAAVELRTTHKHGVEPSLDAAKRAEVKQRFADAGITLWGLGTVCEFHSPDANVRAKHVETCKQFLQLAHDLDATGVKVRPNGLPREVPEAVTLETIGKCLVECGQAAADLGQEVWVEVHGAGTSQPARMRKIMEHCGHACVGITWNSNRDDIQDGSIRPAFELLKPWLRSCHINALYSSYPYRELFTCLRESKYDRYTLVEIPEKVDPVNGALLLKYYRALWRELGRG
jgi:sugar phosphate isomerase/epimerase